MKFVFADNLIARRIKLEFGSEMASYLNFENGFTLTAMDGEKIAGFISASFKKLPYNFENILESFIDVIEVKKEYRRRGIAKKLLKLCEEESKKRGAYQIRAWSSEDKKEAIAMWKKLGFFLRSQEITSAVTKKPVKGYFVGKVLD